MLMRVPLTYLPLCIALNIEAYVSVTRIQEFLTMEEVAPRAQGIDFAHPVKFENASFEWDQKEHIPPKASASWCCAMRNKKLDVIPKEVQVAKLSQINVQVKKGDLCMIVGKVGSGKSSMLQALLGDMKLTDGKVNICGSIAYCAQQSWIQNATLRDNILFGEAFESERYQAALYACALANDLKLFTNSFVF